MEGRDKKSLERYANAMNATLSQNVYGDRIHNEVPPLNITEQVQFTFKVDIHYIGVISHTSRYNIGNQKQAYIY